MIEKKCRKISGLEIQELVTQHEEDITRLAESLNNLISLHNEINQQIADMANQINSSFDEINKRIADVNSSITAESSRPITRIGFKSGIDSYPTNQLSNLSNPTIPEDYD